MEGAQERLGEVSKNEIDVLYVEETTPIEKLVHFQSTLPSSDHVFLRNEVFYLKIAEIVKMLEQINCYRADCEKWG